MAHRKLGKLGGGPAWLLAFTLFVMVGCSQDGDRPSDPGTPSDQPNLNDPLGGFTATDEEPAFGDAELAATVEQEDEVDDAISQDLEGGWESNAELVTYALTITWGVLVDNELGAPEDRADLGGETIDWSGSLSVSDGAIGLNRVISFEREDYVIMPRNDRKVLDWVSTTTDHYDGIRVLIYDEGLQGTDDGAGEATVTFDTPLLKQTFLVSELSDLALTVDVDKVRGIQVRFQAFEARPTLSAKGFLGGRWGWTEGEPNGTFQGRWVSMRGEISGFLRGIYGVDENGNRVFYGKYIDRTGNFQGFLQGTWDVLGQRVGAQREVGTFSGDWLNADRMVVGSLGGHWHTIPERPGFFDGRWRLHGH